MKFKQFIKDNIFNIIVELIYSIIVLVILFYHEPWRDEAQAWLIARDSNFFEIFKQLTYEGHPPLWYLILHPFARLGFPYITTHIISWLICVISGWLILSKSPFDKITKIAFLASSSMMYYLPVISRSYCLVALALTLCSITYNKRHEEPIKYFISLFILANTHIIFYGMLAILTLLFIYEEFYSNRKSNSPEYKKKFISSFIIYCIGLLIVFIPIGFSIIQNSDVDISSRESSEFIVSLNTMVETFNYVIRATFCESNEFFAIIFFIVIFLIGYEFEFYKKNFLIIIISLIVPIYIYSFIYNVTYQRASTIILILMFIYWIQSAEKEKIKLRFVAESCVVVLLVSSLFTTVSRFENEVMGIYSSSKKTSKFIESEIPENSIFLCNNVAYASAVIPYLKDYRFWDPKSKNDFTYVTWDSDYKLEYDFEEMYNIFIENFENNDNLYILYSYLGYGENEVNVYDETGLVEKVYQSEISNNENYSIYKIKK